MLFLSFVFHQNHKTAEHCFPLLATLLIDDSLQRHNDEGSAWRIQMKTTTVPAECQ